MALPAYNVNFRRAHQDNILATGEIVNETSSDYARAMFKILVFDKYHLLGSGIIKVHDFHPKAIREFEALIESIDYKVIAAIFRYEILFEGVLIKSCACGPMDRAPASGAGCAGSIPARRTKL